MITTLYRKYRPQKFSEMIGQRPIVQTLSNAIKNNRIGQSYLFTGPRGTGKTTLARVFAKAVNCEKREGFEPCEDCAVCQNINDGRSLDIIEIDAASNTGVDNIRELRETVKLPPTQAKYKVYIIDEVHMLSAGAFNALLKTLEEPPNHVIFILATTEIHKVPETIISRCQRFDFSRLTLEQIIRKLSQIAEKEKVEIEKEALEIIAIAAEGGMRDAESLLAQIIALEDKSITSKEVEEILGAARHESVEKLAEFILKKDTGKALDLVTKLSEEGTNLEVFGKSLLNYLRQLMVVSVDPDLAGLFSLELTKEQIKKIQEQAKNHLPKEILAILENLIESQQKIRSSFIPSLPLEMAIVRSTQPINPETEQNSRPEERLDSARPDSARLAKRTDQPLTKDDKNSKNENPDFKSTAANYGLRKNSAAAPKNINLAIGLIRDDWGRIIEATRPYNHSLIAFLSNCEPVKIENDTIIIAAKYNFYKDKLNDKSIRSIIEEVAGKILNSPVKIKFVTEEEAGVTLTKQPTTDLPADASHQALQAGDEQQKNSENGSLLDDAMKIMGGKIVKE